MEQRMDDRAIAPVALTGLIVSVSLALAAPGTPGHSHKTFAAGAPGDPKKPARTVEVMMKETDDGKMLFVPNEVEAKRGEQIRFVLKNVGKVDHEFMLDSVERNAKHKIEMQKNPDMEHDDPNGKRLAPGATTHSLSKSCIIEPFRPRHSRASSSQLPWHWPHLARRATAT